MPNPDEFNILTNVQYKLDIHNLPNTTYWAQTTFLPTVQLEGGVLPSPGRDIPVPGHKLEFESLTVTFLIDQDLRNYEEIYYWMVRIGVENDFSAMTSDMTLHFLTGQMNIARSIKFIGAYPTTLTEVAVQSDDSDAVQVVGNVIFQYQYFTFSDGNFPYNVQ
jgi:hypothetical protein